MQRHGRRAAAEEVDVHNITPDLEETDAYAQLVQLAVQKDPSLAALAEQHLNSSPLPRSGAAGQAPPAPNATKAPWLRCATLLSRSTTGASPQSDSCNKVVVTHDKGQGGLQAEGSAGGEIRGDESGPRRPQAGHCLRRGAVPEHRRVLERAHRHSDSDAARRHVHAGLPLLCRQHQRTTWALSLIHI